MKREVYVDGLAKKRGRKVRREERMETERMTGNARDWGNDRVQSRENMEVHRGRDRQRRSEASDTQSCQL